jgi:hypothetical protein
VEDVGSKGLSRAREFEIEGPEEEVMKGEEVEAVRESDGA